MATPLGRFIETEEELQNITQYWKNYSFSKQYLKLQDAVDSLSTDSRLLEARHEFAPRWVLVRPGERKPAKLHTVGIWRWNSDLETGNYVPQGQTPPARLSESRIQNTPNYFCQLSYAIDTDRDKCIWEAQSAFETFIQTQKGFNEHKKERRDWQSGQDANTSRYVFTAQLFVKRSSFTRSKEITYPLHEWIETATQDGSEYFPNPERPTVFEPIGGELRNVREADPPSLKLGDLVWMSFTVEFFIGAKYWMTNFIPREIVRVGRVSPDLLGDIRGLGFDGVDESPDDQLEVGQKFSLVADFPMFDATTEPGVSDQTLAVQHPSGSRVVEHEANEVRFGPEDLETYRVLKRQELERDTTPTSLGVSESEEELVEGDSDADNDLLERATPSSSPSPGNVGGRLSPVLPSPPPSLEPPEVVKNKKRGVKRAASSDRLASGGRMLRQRLNRAAKGKDPAM